ncbi:MAG TPA: hypothetical protein PKE26_15295 [Kiritimatiellia bacterium]|nr:hypothetical protein [Kiritimatiellia bacterium]HMP00461.1 hypothetical protein [Kiritimatiellia bacterium]
MTKKKYNDLSKEALVRLLEARDRQAATRFGLIWNGYRDIEIMAR